MALTIEELPCQRCPTPQGEHIRQRLGQSGELNESECSPFSGLPVDCCRIRATPIPLGQPD
jgi:hypothetical protein